MPFQTFINLPEDKKNQIIDAAIEEFYKMGFEKTSIAKVIERAGIPRGSFYQYFDGKTDLYKYIIVDVIGRRKHEFSGTVLADIEKLGFIEIIKELFISGIQFYRAFPRMAVVATEFVSIKDKEVKKSVLGESEQISNMYFLQLIKERKEKGEIAKEVDEEMLLFLINSLNTTFVDYFMEKTNMNYDDDSLVGAVDKMLAILANGISGKIRG
ncbi:TetR/AcrR family transcriptional regulator [Cytobacillus sp. FJAT-54145]|uniref:TetR/AcrR family transcriptional regulator n=1 Tax=Cytobacillus spartinae TaxID=3299023 RepID=A0ABW6KF29_9BACI